jgi:hypothetical protein
MGLKGAVEIVACPRSLAVGDSDPWVKQAATIRLLSSKTSLYSSEQVYWALSDQRLRHQRNSATCSASAYFDDELQGSSQRMSQSQHASRRRNIDLEDD